ncbi:MAG: sigma-70 family RNA polymerase sigma factor [Pirellulaceae bacterium]|jgi:RNA polymerase sigma-70 factor (ECF subfamily)|nr:sigma-70 family RNA polymerase sigma factor [Pirellulaceae bacterium]MDP7018179.1 sigma-70 family RNA polymerase sigma factor [Pirellulaceae bacterium]
MDRPAHCQHAWLREVVETFEGRLLRYAAHITGDLESARDVVQDTFAKLCRQDRDEVEGHLAEWLFTVCRNRAVDVRRKETRMKTSQVEADGMATRETPQDIVAERRDEVEQVERVLSHLSDNQQEVIRLKFQNGLSYKEIARITQLSVGNVGYLIHTALQKLRVELNVECS